MSPPKKPVAPPRKKHTFKFYAVILLFALLAQGSLLYVGHYHFNAFADMPAFDLSMLILILSMGVVLPWLYAYHCKKEKWYNYLIGMCLSPIGAVGSALATFALCTFFSIIAAIFIVFFIISILDF